MNPQLTFLPFAEPAKPTVAEPAEPRFCQWILSPKFPEETSEKHFWQVLPPHFSAAVQTQKQGIVNPQK